MKKIIFPALLFSFLNISCSSDDITTDVKASQTNLPKERILKNGSMPGNTANQYDYLGKLHAQMLSDYLQNYSPTPIIPTVIVNVDVTANNNTVFNTINSNYKGLKAANMQWIISNALYPVNIINSASMSTQGKIVLASFVNQLDTYENAIYKTVYDSIVAYEGAVIANAALNTNDKRIILTTTSTARHTIAFSGGGDRGWGKTKMGITASINGVDGAEAVTKSIAANILAN